MKKRGYFTGLVYYDWLVEAVKFRLISDLVFVDNSGARWVVPKGAVIVRPILPGPLKAWVADPFCGRMRRATAVFYYFSEIQKVGSPAIYRLYLEAMAIDGVSWVQRYLIYWWLRWFGARWDGDLGP